MVSLLEDRSYDRVDGTGMALNLDFKVFENGNASLPINEFFECDSTEIDETLITRACFALLDPLTSKGNAPQFEGGKTIAGWKEFNGWIHINPEQVRDDFYTRYPNVDDRTHILFPDYKEVMLATNHELQLMRPLRLKLFNAIHERQDKSGVFGIPYSQLLLRGWQIYERSVFEAKPWQVAVSFARTIRHRVNRYLGMHLRDNVPIPIIEFGTGSGNTALALAQQETDLLPTEVTTFDREPGIRELLRHNLKLPIPGIDQFLSSVQISVMNAVDYLRSVNGSTPREFGMYVAAALFVDPPWRATFASTNQRLKVTTLRDMFFISNKGEHKIDIFTEQVADILETIRSSEMAERLPKLAEKYDLWTAEDIVAVAFDKKIAPIVSFHIPSKGFDIGSLEESAKRLNAIIEIIEHTGNDHARQLKEYQLVFYTANDEEKDDGGRVVYSKVSF
ncbi:hypothetical protein A3B57_02105 [Microgenomates group bacterium RIFCSPLOWO2_01_FULL_47_10]|nr:MAG: hypothetical protein A3B57_02105 [Microgenomates group bacterium RIFCSPLOWO2_01_FULL_47_10]